MDQTEKLRATAIALFPEETTEPEARAIVERLADEEDLAGFKTMYRKTILSDGSQRSYIKFSKVVPRNELGSGWVVNITGKLFDAGYDDVAWRVTRLGPDIEDGESTTESFPAELFKEALGDEKDLP
jgi:hypothetical protein